MIDRPREDDPWYEDEEELVLLLAFLYANRFGRHKDTLVASVEANLQGTGNSALSLVDDIADSGGRLLGGSELESVRDVLTRTQGKGLSVVTGDNLTAGARITLADVVEWEAENIEFYANKYFREHAAPRIKRNVQRVLDGDKTVKEFSDLLTAEFGETNQYWRTTGNQSIIRSYNYGILKAGEMNGLTGYILIAVLDSRTSRICRHLDGKEFWISDGVAHYESVLRATPDSIKELHPWVTPEQEDLLLEADSVLLSSSKILVPPFHANCRTTLQPI